MLRTQLLWLFLVAGAGARAQAPCPPRLALWQDLEAASTRLPNNQLITHCEALRHRCEVCHYVRDSVYAKVLHVLGRAYLSAGRLPEAEASTRAAVRVNSLPLTEVRPANRANSYYNLGLIYRRLGRVADADACFTQALRLAEQYPEKHTLIPRIHQEWAILLVGTGDFERAITHNREGARRAEALGLITQQLDNAAGQAQALINLSRYPEATSVLLGMMTLLKTHPDDETLGFVLALLGQNERRSGHAKAAVGYYQRALSLYQHQLASLSEGMTEQERKTEIQGNCGGIANSIAVVYAEDLLDYPQAFRYYRLAQEYTPEAFVKAYIQGNAAKLFVRQGNFHQALQAYQQALRQAPIGFSNRNVEQNPPPEVMRRALYKRYLLYLVREKAGAWLAWAKATNNRAYLHHALATYRTADQMVDFMRWDHTGEQSKKFWRENTHRLYENAIETCHRLNRPEDAFYFFEKSRAALLSDRLNELGASQLLSPADQQREADLQKTVGELRQKVGEAKPGDSLRQKLLTEEEAQTAFVRSLETRNPAYFRYRYDTSAVRLQTVREKLLTEGQTLLEYFVGDSAVYALTVTETTANLTRLAVKDYAQTTRQLLTLSADVAALNQRFPEFLKKSHRLFGELFAPLGVPKGRVIVSPDGAILPLELLSRSSTRPAWLLHDCAFSYTYSAQFLIKQASRRPLVSGSFLGLAPVAFASGQPTLGGSDASLNALSDGFFSPTLLSGSAATKRAFLRELPRHRVAQLYAHAQADSSGREPEIFFADSSLRASELSGLGLLPTQLVVLSACQTGVGQTTRGEGVFSLARSLALAGVPSTVTTLWRVDNVATYRLTELFFEKIGEGLPADEALQQAKLTYLAAAPGSRALPPFWAGMVLIGSAAPLESGTSPWVWVGGGVSLLGLGIWGWRRNDKGSR